MKKTKRIFAILMAVLMTVAVVPVAAFAEDSVSVPEVCVPSLNANYYPGEIIVGFGRVVTPQEVEAALSEIEYAYYEDLHIGIANYVLEKEGKLNDYCISVLDREFMVYLEENTKEAVIEALSKLVDNQLIAYAHQNPIYKRSAVTPNDPMYAPTSGTPQWGLEKIRIGNLWEYVTGGDIQVAVLDTGIDHNHPDLEGNVDMSLAYNAYNPSSDSVMDYDGHGTQVAGIIGAKGNNNLGVSGVLWDVDIVPVKIVDDDPDNEAQSGLEIIVEALDYISNCGIPVANLSFGLIDGEEEILYAALRASFLNYSETGGIITISAGNDSMSIDNVPPYNMICGLPGVIIVGAIPYSMGYDIMAGFSNYGGNTVHIFAPGGDINSTYLDNDYWVDYGTSFAAPYVAGVAALLRLANPSLPNSIIKNAIINGAVYSSYLDGKCVADGRLDALKAFNAVGKRITVDPDIENGSVTASGIVSPSNRSVTITVDPDPGYLLKPGSLVYGYSGQPNNPVSSIALNYYYFTMPNASVFIMAEFYMIGDIDLDGVITVADSLAVLRHAAGNALLTGDALLAADVNGDGNVTQVDSNIILSYVAGEIDSFPIEG